MLFAPFFHDGLDLVCVDADHRLAEVLGKLRQELRILPVRHGLHDRGGALRRIPALEDTRPDEDAFRAKFHHERGIGRCGNAAGGEIDDRQTSVVMHERHEVERRGKLLGRLEEFVLAQRRHTAYLGLYPAQVPYGLHDVACAGFALRADHRRTLAYAAKSFAKIARAADERNLELRLVDVPHIVGGRQHLALVDVVYLYRLENPRFGDVAYAALCHHWYRHGILYRPYHRRVAHAADATYRPYVRRDALESHHRACARRLRYLRLLGRGHIHYHPALEHLGEIAVQFLTVVHCFLLFCVGN